MNITEKSFSETIDFQLQACRRAVAEQSHLSVQDRRSLCNVYIERLRGIRMLVISFPKAISDVSKVIAELETFRNQLADVGRSPVQSAEVLGQGSNHA